jgi:hypothetical protein
MVSGYVRVLGIAKYLQNVIKYNTLRKFDKYLSPLNDLSICPSGRIS